MGKRSKGRMAPNKVSRGISATASAPSLIDSGPLIPKMIMEGSEIEKMHRQMMKEHIEAMIIGQVRPMGPIVPVEQTIKARQMSPYAKATEISGLLLSRGSIADTALSSKKSAISAAKPNPALGINLRLANGEKADAPASSLELKGVFLARGQMKPGTRKR